MKIFQVELQYQDRVNGPGTIAGKTKVEGTSLAVGIAKGVRQIMKTVKDRKVRNDMMEHGVTINCLVSDVAEKKEAVAAQA